MAAKKQKRKARATRRSTAKTKRSSAASGRARTASRGRSKGTGAGAKPARARAKSTATGGGTRREIEGLKARFQREKSALERRLTESVQEIGQLRHHEARVQQLERELKARDETITKLRNELGEARGRRREPLADEDAQRSLALGSREPDDLDDFGEDILPGDDDDELG